MPGMGREQKPRGKRPFAAMLSVALSASTALSGHAQVPADVAAYRLLVDDYRAARPTAEGDLKRLTTDPSIIDRVIEPSSGWSPVDLAAAAMLHTDVSLRLVKMARQPDAVAHIDAATTLLRAAVARRSELAPFARRWRETVAGLLHAFGAPEIASNLSTNGMKWLPESEEQLRAMAAFEMGITAEIQAAVAGPLSGPQPKRTSAVPPDARRELRAAARHFEVALAADPACTEAALHLGRVTLLDGRDVEAARWLRAASAAHSVPVRYLGMMFLGVIAERQARYDEAAKQYRAALDTFPWGQAAPLALSHVLMRAGWEQEARETLAVHFARTRGRTVEPLWTYLANPATDLGPSLDQLRAEVWR
jgi:tetratricopeptide (TPR) repeat protein